MTVEDFNYFLPEELIAQTPLAERPSSRLLVLDKKTGEVSHQSFRNVLDYLESGDCLVLNDTKVLPARLLGTNATGAAIEFLLLSQREGDPQNGDDIWEIIVRPGRKCKEGDGDLYCLCSQRYILSSAILRERGAFPTFPR